MANLHTADTEEFNLVAHWLRWDPKRLLAGALAGIFAGVLMAVFAMILCLASGYEVWYPIKVAAIPLMGGAAMDYGNFAAIIVGLVVMEVLAVVLGMVYAQLSGTNLIGPLLGLGLVFGIFSWIFISCLFIQSFTEVFALRLSVGAAFPVNLVFGLALTSVAFFDRMVRGGR